MASSASVQFPWSYTSSTGNGYCRSQAMGCYDLMDTLGRGNFATVKKAVHAFSGEEVAVKIIDKTKLDANGKSHLLQEVRCMRLVQHPNIVRLYEIIDTPTTLFLVLELADGGDLYDYMLKNEKAMSEKTARHYFGQIVRAVEYCHQLHVVHRDLKPENVLMFRKHRMVKLTDFGFGHFCQPGISLDTSCGSLRYSSPEILFGQRYDGPAVDVWGLGILLYVMVCGRPPFMELNDSETISAIMDCRYPIPPTLSASCIHLIGRMIVKNPEKRATVAEILQHVWLQSALPLQSPGSGSMECDGLESHVSTLNCPLVMSRHLSDDAHERIIKIMLDGGVAAHPDDIDCALSSDEYNNITATYYLLAERLLRIQAPPPDSMEEEEFVPVSAHFGTMDTDDFRAGRGLNGRCRGRLTTAVGKRPIDLHSVAEMLEELEEEEGDMMENSVIGDPAHRTKNASPRYSPSSNRRLVNTKSSPHLNMLNKIKEEVKLGQADDDDDFLDEAFFVEMERASNDPNSLRNRERQLTSPERLKRIERSRRTRSRSGSGSSQTSSDTSDTEEVGTSTSRTGSSRLPFSRHRIQPPRHRSASSCSNTHTYSRESSENASPIRGSAPVLFQTGDDLETTYSSKCTNTKKRLPVLQHSQSLMVIPCHTGGKLAATGAKSGKKRNSLHRPHSLPPVPHIKFLFDGTFPMAQGSGSSSASPRLSGLCIRQQC